MSMSGNLRQYISLLESAGELVRVTAEVDPVLEIAEITDRVSKSPGGGKALLFTNTGTEFPVLTNMMGSDRRMAVAMGVGSLDEITRRIEELAMQVLSPKNGLGDKLRMLPLLGEVSRWMPRISQMRGECQQVVLRDEQVDLDSLPILKCWPGDAGRFITLPLVNTVDPLTGVRNVGMYRMQIMDRRTTALHWHLHKTGERHYRAYKKLGQGMPVSVCIGGDPLYTYAATAPMPDGMDEYILAGFLRRRSVKLVKCVTNDIYVPADCDFVIEGYVDPAEDKVMEGPFGDHTGFYSLEDHYPVFHVTAVTHRKDAIYPATLVGIPPQEDLYIAKATEKIFLTPMRLALQPEIRDLYMPSAGVAHNLAIVSIETAYSGQAFKVASSMWGAGQMMFNKVLLVAEAGQDIRSTKVLSALVRGIDPEHDIMLSRGVLDILDHASEKVGEGGKMVLDLTGQKPDEKVKVPELKTTPAWVEGVDLSCADEWGIVIVRCGSDLNIRLQDLLPDEGWGGIKYVVALDRETENLPLKDLLWFALANLDPARDLCISDGVVYADARTKYPYRQGYPRRVPNVVVSSRETVGLVDGRWKEYGLGPFVESPSLIYRKLLRGESAQIK